MAYESGYTSAVDSASNRDTQSLYRQRMLMEMAQMAAAAQQQQQARQRQMATRTALGNLLPELAKGGGPAPQPPAPGAASMPMTPPGAMGQIPPPPGIGFASPPPAGPPQGAPPMPQGAGPGAPGAKMGPGGAPGAPMGPQGWKQLPKPPEAVSAAPGAIGPPPEESVMPKQLMSVADLAKLLEAKGIKGAQAIDMIEEWKPFMDSENKQQLDALKIQNTAQTNAMKAYADTVKRMERERHDRELERQGAKRLDQGDKRININVGGGENDLAKDPETRRFMAEQYWAGDKSVLQNLGRGAQGAKNIVALRKEIVAVGKETGKSPKDLAASMAEFEGMKSGERTLGTRSANIEMAATEAKNLAEIAMDASEAVDRTQFKAMNDIQQAIQKKTASPQLRAFTAANTSLINAYARAINPQGVGTVADKEHAREMLDTAFSKGDYRATVQQLLKEIEAAQKSPRQVKGAMREGFTGKGDSDYVELRKTPDGRTLGRKADGTVEVVQ